MSVNSGRKPTKIKGKHSIGRELKVWNARKETIDIDIFVTSRNGDKNHAIYKNRSPYE